MDSTRRLVWSIVATVVLATAAPWLLARRIMGRGRELARFDRPRPTPMKPARAVGPEVGVVVDRLRAAQSSFSSADRDQRRQQVRQWLDRLGEGVVHDCEVIPVATDSCRGDWVVPPDAEPGRRMLYLHGGAFEAGSPTSHRGLTTRIAEQTRTAVFVVDYRLSPEHTRQEALDDVDAAWALVCAAGPEGPAALRAGLVAGDSAGANLALGLAHRCRDGDARLPDGVVAMSPMTDSTFSSPSWHENIGTDPFLEPAFGRLLDVPRELLVLGLWAATRIRPDDPRVSPLLDDLSGLPPTLVQASASEMLRDDVVRYARAARAAGSPVELQVWPDMVHVWQAFPDLPEAQEAMREIVDFLGRCADAATGPQSAADTIA